MEGGALTARATMPLLDRAAADAAALGVRASAAAFLEAVVKEATAILCGEKGERKGQEAEEGRRRYSGKRKGKEKKREGKWRAFFNFGFASARGSAQLTPRRFVHRSALSISLLDLATRFALSSKPSTGGPAFSPSVHRTRA